MQKITDQSHLLKTQYQNAANLNARIRLHEDFSTNPESWLGWVFDHFQAPPQAQVLEIGCGPASLWCENLSRIPTAWQIILTDLSVGMLEEAKAALGDQQSRFKFEPADAQALPFDDAQFDLIIANHMLYHVPNRPQAYAEIRRVLKPAGRFYAATNGIQHLQEFYDLMRQVNSALLAQRDIATWFSLENGEAELAAWFSHVTRHRYHNDLRVTEVEPLVAYAASMQSLTETELQQIQALIEAQMQVTGAIHITKSTGLFEAYGIPVAL